MLKDTVVIKSNAYGLILDMDATIPFEELLDTIGKKFKDSAKFFKNAKMGISFKGRELTDEQEKAILNIISENSQLNIVCVLRQKRYYWQKTESFIRAHCVPDKYLKRTVVW